MPAVTNVSSSTSFAFLKPASTSPYDHSTSGSPIGNLSSPSRVKSPACHLTCLSFGGPITREGVQDLLSPILRPSLGTLDQTEQPAAPLSKADASLKYFKAVQQKMNEVRKSTNPTFAKLATTFNHAARHIDDLPILKIETHVVQRQEMSVDGDAAKPDQLGVAQPVLERELGAAVRVSQAADGVQPLEKHVRNHRGDASIRIVRAIGGC